MRAKTCTVLLVFVCALAGCWQKDLGRSFYPSGKVRTEATVRNGLLDGPATMFYESGAKMSEANYRAGILDGKSVAYFENGNKKSSAIYKEGYLNGPSIEWNEKGEVVAEVNFELGRLVTKGKSSND